MSQQAVYKWDKLRETLAKTCAHFQSGPVLSLHHPLPYKRIDIVGFDAIGRESNQSPHWPSPLSFEGAFTASGDPRLSGAEMADELIERHHTLNKELKNRNAVQIGAMHHWMNYYCETIVPNHDRHFVGWLLERTASDTDPTPSDGWPLIGYAKRYKILSNKDWHEFETILQSLGDINVGQPLESRAYDEPRVVLINGYPYPLKEHISYLRAGIPNESQSEWWFLSDFLLENTGPLALLVPDSLEALYDICLGVRNARDIYPLLQEYEALLVGHRHTGITMHNLDAAWHKRQHEFVESMEALKKSQQKIGARGVAQYLSTVPFYTKMFLDVVSAEQRGVLERIATTVRTKLPEVFAGVDVTVSADDIESFSRRAAYQARLYIESDNSIGNPADNYSGKWNELTVNIAAGRISGLREFSMGTDGSLMNAVLTV
ncbi:MAG: hypothetical protein GF363_05855 [Chitinivibrionales bacterium]|nr:hypothetical protein [Chitinivibrionales bacterium]